LIPTLSDGALIIDAIEEKYPMLRGTIRDHETQKRRPLVRFFACGEDISHDHLITPAFEVMAKDRALLYHGRDRRG